jgi:hypothetical protein
LFKQNNLPLALTSLEAFLTETQGDDPSSTQMRQKAEGWLVDIKKDGEWS